MSAWATAQAQRQRGLASLWVLVSLTYQWRYPEQALHFCSSSQSYSALKNPFKDHKLYLLGKTFEFRAALYDKFYQYPEYFTILSECTKSLMREIDVVIIPCTNSWGFSHESFVGLLKYVLLCTLFTCQTSGSFLQEASWTTGEAMDLWDLSGRATLRNFFLTGRQAQVCLLELLKPHPGLSIFWLHLLFRLVCLFRDK